MEISRSNTNKFNTCLEKKLVRLLCRFFGERDHGKKEK